MREIKFRGKRLDNGEWVYGDLQHRAGGQCAIVVPEPDGNGVWGYAAHFVDPATVGQFTGLQDKHGREIYEGDIVVLRRGKNISNTQTIEWCSHASAFVRVIDGMDAHFISEADMDLYEVIGNIHDNPELLK